MNAQSELLNELRIDRGETEHGSHRLGWIIGSVVLVLLLIGLAGWMFLRQQAIPVHSVPVQAISAGAASSSVLDATGYVVARRMATVSSKVTGRVQDVLIEEGQQVQEGEVLARLDPEDAQAQVDLAEARLAAARSQIASVGAQLEEAESQLARIQTLIERKLAPTSQLDQAQASRDSLAAQKITAERNAVVAEESLAIARIGLDNTVVRAPFAGVVIAKAAQPGEIVSPLSAGGGFTRTGIGTIVDMDSLEVEVDVNEAFIGRVEPNMPVKATLNAYPDWAIPAHVIAIIPAADRGKATVRVRIALEQNDARIVPDMGVRVSFLEATSAAPSQAKPGLRVPQSAIVQRDGRALAFSVRQGLAVRHALTLGRTLGSDREVLGGLSAGQRVIVDPPPNLVDGSAVTEATPNP